VLGDYADSLEPEAVTVTGRPRDANAPSPAIAAMKGKRLVRVSETEEGARLAAALIKKLSGGDMLTGRFLHRDLIHFMPTLKLFIYTNHVP
jgi:putative DNA primase/helicase